MNPYECGKWDYMAYNYDNPYDKGTPEYDQWICGYSDAEHADFDSDPEYDQYINWISGYSDDE